MASFQEKQGSLVLTKSSPSSRTPAKRPIQPYGQPYLGPLLCASSMDLASRFASKIRSTTGGGVKVGSGSMVGIQDTDPDPTTHIISDMGQ